MTSCEISRTFWLGHSPAAVSFQDAPKTNEEEETITMSCPRCTKWDHDWNPQKADLLETAQLSNLACSVPKFFGGPSFGGSGYIKQFAAWIGLEPCRKGAPNDQHFRGTWHFSYSQVGCAKERFSHWACHWFHIVTVPICLKMQK